MKVVNYIRMFTAELAQSSTDMRELLKSNFGRGGPPKQGVKEFQMVKQVITSTPISTPFEMEKNTRPFTNASSFGLGAALLQEIDEG